MEALLNGDGWVQFIFADRTRITIHTSLNREVLKQYGAFPKEGMLFNLEKLKYVPFREDAVEIVITKDKPTWEGDEVLEFANRFI